VTPPTLVDMTQEVYRLSRLLDQGLDFLREQAVRLAQAEHDYRLARAESWPATKGTAKEREDAVNALCAAARKERDTAEHLRQAAIESVRSRRAQVSAIQSLLNAHRAEAEMDNYGPRSAP
jgi:hypothetical protein